MKSAQHPKFQEALTALDNGDLSKLDDLLKEHSDLVHSRCDLDTGHYARYFHNATLLHHVAGNPIRVNLPSNIVKISRLLLDRGADIHAICGGGPGRAKTKGGTTVLGLLISGARAYEQGFTESLLDLFLDAGAQMDSKENPGGLMWAALYRTVEYPHQWKVARLLYERGHPIDMCFAAGLGLLEKVQSHLKKRKPGKDADFLYRNHRSSGKQASPKEIRQDAFIFSVVCGHLKVAEFLWDRGADINGQRSWGPEVITPLHGAVWAGWLEMTDWLLSKGASTFIRDPNHFSTPVGWADHVKRKEIFDMFFENDKYFDLLDSLEFNKPKQFRKMMKGKDPDMPIATGSAGILMRMAAYKGHLGMVKFLIEIGADASITNEEGKTALDYAIEQEKHDIASLLSSLS